MDAGLETARSIGAQSGSLWFNDLGRRCAVAVVPDVP